MSSATGIETIPESTDEETLAEDPHSLGKAITSKDIDWMHDSHASHLAPPSANRAHHLPTPALSPSLHPATPDSEPEPLSPPHHTHINKPYHPSPLHHEADHPSFLSTPAGDQRPAPSSTAVSAGGSSTLLTHRNEGAFPFPNVRPIGTDPASQVGNIWAGLDVPPTHTSGTATPMSSNVSAASTQEHHEPPISTRPSRSVSQSGKPTMLSAIGEKKSFFQKMFHHEGKDKDGKRDKDRMSLNIPPAMESGRSSPRATSPHPHSWDMSDSPPLTPAGDSEYSRPPSRAPSFSRRKSDQGDPHAQPPADRRSGTPPPSGGLAPPSLQRRSSNKSQNGSSKKHLEVDPTKVVATIAGTPVALAKKEDVIAASGNKFTFKDLIALGESGPKINRKPSAFGSHKGSESGSTKGSERDVGDNGSTASLLKKYGICDKAAIGKGATAVVRLAHKWDRREEKLYAVKEFRKRRKNETEKDYVKKLTSEFCISSTLHHSNIVETVDLVQDEGQHWCEVMEYCPGGDLYAAIKKGGMSSGEVECSFKQILLGIQYLHQMGVAHRDIKPENLLLDGRGHVKITDFGVSDVFRMCWEKKTHLSKGLCGSEPYIAPELFDHKEYDARLVDVWAAAIVFYCMQFQELPWRVAKSTDSTFVAYLQQYQAKSETGQSHPTPPPLNNLVPRECRGVIKHMLDPDPRTRWTVDEALKDKWLAGVEVCVEGQHNSHGHTSAGMEIVKLAQQ